MMGSAERRLFQRSVFTQGEAGPRTEIAIGRSGHSARDGWGRFHAQGVGSWDAPFSHVGEEKETTEQDVAIQKLKEGTKAENQRVKQTQLTARTQISAHAATSASRWTPVIVVVGAVVAGGIILAIANRRKRK